jgi:MORN repeat
MGTKDGFGTYTWADASKFQGDWKDNKIDGKVTCFFCFLCGRELILGLMAGAIRVNGRTITCMDSEYIPGQMAEGMKVSISMTRNMASASTSGLMAGSI